MQQYLDIKSENPNAVLLFRLGDFFESFFGDAIQVSKALDLVLTHRGTDDRGVDIPMCGIPWHAADSYFAKLVKQGFSVAIAEQTETPEEAAKRGHKQIERKLVRVLTAGTLTDDYLLAPKKSNYLVAVAGADIAVVDISTGEFLVGQSNNLLDDMTKLEPAEILFDESVAEDPEILRIRAAFNTTAVFSKEYDNFPDGENPAQKMMFMYLKRTQRDGKINLKTPKNLWAGKQLLIDANSWKSLEIDSALNAGGMTLLDIIDQTKTAAGGRKLRSWLRQLSGDLKTITDRQDYIEHFVKNTAILQNFSKTLVNIPDVSRAITRLESGRGMPRDLVAISEFLKTLPRIKDAGKDLISDLSKRIQGLETFDDLKNELVSALSVNQPTFFRDGGVIAHGFNSDLDAATDMANGARELIAALQNKYSADTGVSNLKIKFNNMLGYFVEIPASKSAMLNSDFIHRQTMSDNMRFTTTRLSELDSEIKNASGRAASIEQEIISVLIDHIKNYSNEINQIADIISEIDIYTALANVAIDENWIRPNIVEEPIFIINGGRHPVVEKTLRSRADAFIKNDCDLSTKSVALLTGPNMSGKSTYLRQNAIIVILAHMGSFVPADVAEIGLVDQLFSRVGASDNLASGQSTFMVEMSETANILNRATNKSFIIFDEIGRGTSTFDGMAIAQAVLEFTDSMSPRCLFATHYHELTTIPMKNVKNLTTKVAEADKDIIFLHKIGLGVANRSYGIHVAKMAGMPSRVVKSAERILEKLESKKSDDGQPSLF
jgi:DNA mismatch repair protein MutS